MKIMIGIDSGVSKEEVASLFPEAKIEEERGALSVTIYEKSDPIPFIKILQERFGSRNIWQ